MSWHKIHMGLAGTSTHIEEALHNSFMAIFLASGSPVDAAMFATKDTVHYAYYFSPGAVTIAQSLIERFYGVECPAPSRDGLIGLISNGGMESIPFAPISDARS